MPLSVRTVWILYGSRRLDAIGLFDKLREGELRGAARLSELARWFVPPGKSTLAAVGKAFRKLRDVAVSGQLRFDTIEFARRRDDALYPL
jgi:hypothetical protein